MSINTPPKTSSHWKQHPAFVLLNISQKGLAGNTWSWRSSGPLMSVVLMLFFIINHFPTITLLCIQVPSGCLVVKVFHILYKNDDLLRESTNEFYCILHAATAKNIESITDQKHHLHTHACVHIYNHKTAVPNQNINLRFSFPGHGPSFPPLEITWSQCWIHG